MAVQAAQEKGFGITNLEHSLEIAQSMNFLKLCACMSGVAAESGRLSGLNDPSLPMGGARGPRAMAKAAQPANTRGLPHA